MQEEPINNINNLSENPDSTPEGSDIPVDPGTEVGDFNSTPDISSDNPIVTSPIGGTNYPEESPQETSPSLNENSFQEANPGTENIVNNSSTGNDTYSPEVLSSSSVVQGPNQSHKLKALLIVICLVLIIGIAAGAGYLYGKRSVKTVPTSNTSSMSQTASLLKVPQGATIMEQCVAGLGTQYILPKDIPDGPVYNVYQGKVIGIEYMINLASIEKLNTAVTNLPLFNQTYDHINIMSMAAHAGFPVPHYQVDVMMVPTSFTNKITCNGSTSMSTGSMTGSMTSSSGSKTASPTTTTK